MLKSIVRIRKTLNQLRLEGAYHPTEKKPRTGDHNNIVVNQQINSGVSYNRDVHIQSPTANTNPLQVGLLMDIRNSISNSFKLDRIWISKI